jgi:hypothetical protein
VCIAGYGKLTSGVTTNNNCAICAAGKYRSTVADADCTACNAGTTTSGTGVAGDHGASTDCNVCTAGYGVSSGSPNNNCASCAVGTFRAGVAAAACTVCAEGFYAAATGLSACTACADGFTTTTSIAASAHDAATDCQTCSPTYFSPSGLSAGLQTDCITYPPYTATKQELPKDTVAITTVGVILSVGVLGAVAYFYFFAKQATTVVNASGKSVELVAGAEEA